MENRFNIRTAFLPDDEADRIYRRYPFIGEDAESYCPTCEKKGTFQWRGQTWRCDCQEQLQLYKHYLAAGIGVTYQRLEWLDLEGCNEIISRINEYLEKHQRYVSRGVGLFFSGTVGTGKTMVANLVLKSFVKMGYSCFSTTFAQTIDYLTAGWNSPEDKAYFRRKFVDSQVLLLDDVGREHRTKLSDTTFDSILRTRVQEGRPTIITTNMKPGELSTGYGAAILSLLQEASLYFEFSGDDFRPKSQQRTVEEVKSGETRPIT